MKDQQALIACSINESEALNKKIRPKPDFLEV